MQTLAVKAAPPRILDKTPGTHRDAPHRERLCFTNEQVAYALGTCGGRFPDCRRVDVLSRMLGALRKNDSWPARDALRPTHGSLQRPCRVTFGALSPQSSAGSAPCSSMDSESHHHTSALRLSAGTCTVQTRRPERQPQARVSAVSRNGPLPSAQASQTTTGWLHFVVYECSPRQRLKRGAWTSSVAPCSMASDYAP